MLFHSCCLVIADLELGSNVCSPFIPEYLYAWKEFIVHSAGKIFRIDAMKNYLVTMNINFFL